MTRVMCIPANRCHSYDVSVTKTRQVKYYDYTCKCGKDFKISSIIHNKMVNGIKNPHIVFDMNTLTRVTKPSYARNCSSCRTNIFLKSDTTESLLEQMKRIQDQLDKHNQKSLIKN